MKILLDIGHPGHVLFYRNAISQLTKRGHQVLVTARDKEVVFQLLKAYGIPYLNRGGAYTGLLRKALGMLKIDAYMLKTALKFKPDVLTGIHNPYIAHSAFLMGKPSVIFTDTEHARIANLLTFPFATRICTPNWFKKDLGVKHVRYDGFKELAYLSPKYFKPDINVIDRMDVGKNEKYAVVRLVSWKAAHDVNQRGILNPARLIKKLEANYRVFLSSESPIPREFEKYKLKTNPEELQSVLYYASMQVGEGSTTATEAGLLGTPSVYISTLVGTMGNFEELRKLQLVYSYKTIEEAEPKINELIEDADSKKKWAARSMEVTLQKADVADFIAKQIESYGR
ncbi:MAG: DUF354 domain-containing protein [Candidatus Altiarchaeota archaeon]